MCNKSASDPDKRFQLLICLLKLVQLLVYLVLSFDSGEIVSVRAGLW